MFYRKFDIHTQLDKISDNIITILKQENIKTSEINCLLEKVEQYFKDSTSRNEISYLESIIILYKTVLIEYIKQIDKYKLKDDGNKFVETMNNRIILTFFRNYEQLVQKDSDNILLKNLKNCLSDLLTTLIKTEKKSIFDLCILEIENLFFDSIDNNNQKISFDILDILIKIYKTNIKVDTYKIYTEEIDNLINKKLLTVIRIKSEDNSIQKKLVKATSLIFVHKIKNDANRKKGSILSLFKQFIYISTRESHKNDTFIWIYLFFIVKEILDLEDNDLNNELIECVDFSIDLLIKENIQDAMYHLAFLIQNLEENIKDEQQLKKLRHNKFIYTLQMIEFLPESSFLFAPNFKKHFKELIEANKDIDMVKKEFSTILDKIIRAKNGTVLYSFLDELNAIILDCSKNQRVYQEQILDIYMDSLRDALIVKSVHNFKLLLFKFEILIKKMDETNSISKNLALYILNIISKVCFNLSVVSNDSISKLLLNFLTSIVMELKSFSSDKNYKKKAVEIIYSTSIDSLESNNLSLTRICSNSLGWYAKELLDSGDNDNFKECMKSATDIYKLSNDLKINIHVKVFLGTLFVILGAYVYGKKQINLYNSIITMCKGLPNKDIFAISKKVRSDNLFNWEDSIKLNCSSSMDKFIQDLTKTDKRKNVKKSKQKAVKV